MTKGEYEMKGRLSRESSLFSTDPQIQLLNKLRQGDLRSVKKILAADTVDIDHCYDYPDYKTCLQIACSDRGYSEFVKELLKYNADVNLMNETHNRAPIHFAVETGDEETVKVLLEADGININALCKGNTPLHLAIKQVEDIDEDRENAIRRYEDIVEMLVKAGCDVNIPDMKNITPVYSAAKQGMEEMVKLMTKYSNSPLDLDSYADRRKKTARDMIQSSFPHLLHIMPERDQIKDKIDVSKLFSYISGQDEDKFVAAVEKIKKTNEFSEYLKDNNGLYTLLQFACYNGLDRAASVLLENGADPNLTAPGNGTRPIALACFGGYFKILKILTTNDSTSLEPVNGESLLQIVIKSNKKPIIANSKVDYIECMDILLKKPISDINFLDDKYNTALHYAARSGNQDTVMTLLKKGACIGIRNRFNEPPLADMSAKTFEAYLDDCLTTNMERPNDEDYELKFNYSFLVPPSNAVDGEACKVPLMDDSNVSVSDNDCLLAPETDALLYMTQNPELRPLLKHPVITSFLYLKWQRISCLFYANITFYALFWLSLIFYILFDGDLIEKTDVTNGLARLMEILTWIGLLVLLFREILQAAVSPKLYFKSIENWLEICLIVVTAAILFKDIANIETAKQPLCAIAILLSSAELVLLIGQFPALSTNIVMLKTVSWNFFKFLLWYCILIIAFALSFYTLFRTVEPVKKEDDESIPFNPNKPAEEDEEKDFFVDPGMSLFKTIVMLTGEFDAGSINFDSFPVISHMIFMIFVFMIPIVLFNLLNGLAVSDTQSIKANAELVGHISRIEMISYFEGVLLGDLVPYRNAVSKMQNACCWLPGRNCIKSRMICIKPLARRICLFPNFLPMAQIGVKTNQNSRVVIYTNNRLKKKQEKDVENPELILCCLRSCSELKMERKVVKAARNIITEREESKDSEYKKIESRLMACMQEKFTKFENILEEIHKSVMNN